MSTKEINEFYAIQVKTLSRIRDGALELYTYRKGHTYGLTPEIDTLGLRDVFRTIDGALINCSDIITALKEQDCYKQVFSTSYSVAVVKVAIKAEITVIHLMNQDGSYTTGY